jgi:hypothetical protein
MSLYSYPSSSGRVRGSVHSILGKTTLQIHPMGKLLHECGNLKTTTPPYNFIDIFGHTHLQNDWLADATSFSSGWVIACICVHLFIFVRVRQVIYPMYLIISFLQGQNYTGQNCIGSETTVFWLHCMLIPSKCYKSIVNMHYNIPV